jgi:hypothetical protein
VIADNEDRFHVFEQRVQQKLILVAFEEALANIGLFAESLNEG